MSLKLRLEKDKGVGRMEKAETGDHRGGMERSRAGDTVLEEGSGPLDF